MSHSLCEKLARWLLQDRECFETAQRAVNLSSPSAFFLPFFSPSLPSPPSLQTQMGATVMLLARSRTLAKWISDSEMMAGWQWITDGGGFNVCNPCPSITELSFFRGDHHSSLLLFFSFFLTQSSSLLEHCVSTWERLEIALHCRRALIRYGWIAGPGPILYIFCVNSQN